MFVNAGLFPQCTLACCAGFFPTSQDEIPFTNYKDSYRTLTVAYSQDCISDLLNFGPLFCKQCTEGSRKYPFMKYGKLPG